VFAESSGVQLLVSIGIEVTLDSGVYNGHILNKWSMRIWFEVLCYLCSVR
jgi:hypothetical protein